MRGEDLEASAKQVLADGSPPHARGRPAESFAGGRAVGITPACAGKTIDAVKREMSPRDHPRMRGEDSKVGIWCGERSGSPPHARGRQGYLGSATVWTGITPACAGKTRPHSTSSLISWDHPRMRGEDAFVKCTMT